MTKRFFLWKGAYLLISLAAFLADQTVKAWAARSLRFSGDRPIIDGLLTLAYAENTGVAFSMLNNYGDSGRWGLSAVAIFSGALVLYFFWRTPRTDDRVLGALALLLAGIAGNVADRMRLGFVIDYIDVQFGNWHYPTFNGADILICTGAGLLILDMFITGRKEKRDAAKAAGNAS